MTVPSSSGSWLPQLPGFRLFTSLWGSLLAVDFARGVHAWPWAAILLVAAVVALSSLGQRALAAVMICGVGWLVVTGFVVNDYGELALSGPADLGRLGVMLAAVLLASGVRHLDPFGMRGRRVDSGNPRAAGTLAVAGSVDARHGGER